MRLIHTDQNQNRQDPTFLKKELRAACLACTPLIKLAEQLGDKELLEESLRTKHHILKTMSRLQEIEVRL